MQKLTRLCLLFCLCSGSAFAQAVAGLSGLSGNVRDASGASVPGAAVLVTNEAKGIRRTLETNGSGLFTAPALVPAAGYKVTVTKAGFAQYEATNIVLQVGQNVDLNIRLGVATSATQVDVNADAQLVDDTKTDVSQVVNSLQIVDLPINGRRVDSFVLLTPAVVPDGTFGLISFRGVAGGNSFLTDGNDTTNQYYNENAGRTRIASQISQDAVQEFQVVSNNFAAEYGRASGGVVNTVTRSGGNALHGTAYWFFRNRTLNARDRYANFNPPEWRHQVGGSIGGAIKKDKLFYFLNYEKTKRNFPLIASLTSAPLFNANGIFQDVQPNGSATCAAPATAAQCTTAKNFVTTRNFGLVPRTVDQDLAFGKIDYRPSERNTFSFSMNYLRWVSPNGIQTQAVLNNGNGIGNNANSTVRTRYGRATWTSIISASAVNEARFGWFKDRLADDASPDFLSPALGKAGLTVAGVGNLGYANSYPRLNPSEQRFQYADNFNLIHGRHTMKFGVDINRTEDYQNQLSNQYGSYSYPSFTAFAQDFSGNTGGGRNYTTYSQRFGNPIVDTFLTDYGFYAQDQFKISTKLQVNYGVRYEYSSIPQPKLVNPDYPQTGMIPSATKNFAPRVGASYSFNPKTVIRAGYGIFYARYQTGLINTLFVNNNVYQRALTLDITKPTDLAIGPLFPNNLANLDRTPPLGTTGISFADKNLRNPYTHQANFAVERQLTSTISLTVSYLWSRGVRLYTTRDLNVGPLGAPVTYTIQDVNKNAVGSYTTPTYRLANRVDARYNRINQVENGGLSYYDGLAVQVNKRFTKGLQASLAYTWSHAIDFNQGAGGDNIFFSGGPSSYFNGDYAGEKGSSVLDIRHRLVVNSVWRPTFTSSTGLVGRYLVNGWEVSQITTLQSSPPVTASVQVTGSAFTGAAFSASLNGLGGSSRVPFVPLNGVDVDRIYRVDARLTKILPFNERVNLSLYFEGFNIFNTPYDTAVRTPQYQVSGGIFSPLTSFHSGFASQAFPDGTNARRAQVGLRLTF
jgi:outer membrane receptor protein involved in Fe transport